MQSTINYLAENLIAFLSVFFAAYLMTTFVNYTVELSALFYLPLGAKILMYLLFGFRIFPGILAACITSGVILFDSWGGNLLLGTLSACAGATAPIIVMSGMKLAKMCDFDHLGDIDFRHILTLVMGVSVVSSLLKYFVFAQSIYLDLAIFDFITHYIAGDVMGALLVIYLVLKVLVPLIQRIVPQQAS
ncbi:MAG: hypothetical protein ISR70_01445 [Candidatus Thioglobus sp.]|nr:hypothetical protein [Candidatus Thioglobus pontius]MBL6976707.1 hypothetical protein [Candidatus Thioglobus sp.]MBL6984349.1 hypothetical protein [Candidatus Thioglobus sp.]